MGLKPQPIWEISLDIIINIPTSLFSKPFGRHITNVNSWKMKVQSFVLMYSGFANFITGQVLFYRDRSGRSTMKSAIWLLPKEMQMVSCPYSSGSQHLKSQQNLLIAFMFILWRKQLSILDRLGQLIHLRKHNIFIGLNQYATFMLYIIRSLRCRYSSL